MESSRGSDCTASSLYMVSTRGALVRGSLGTTFVVVVAGVAVVENEGMGVEIGDLGRKMLSPSISLSSSLR